MKIILIVVVVLLLFVFIVAFILDNKARNDRREELLKNMARLDKWQLKKLGYKCENCYFEFTGENIRDLNLVERHPSKDLFCCRRCYEEWIKINKI